MNNIVSFKKVTKEYKSKTAVRDVSFDIKVGDIYGLIGENGAGKSTILKLITNLVKSSTGRVEVFGQEVKKDSYEYLKNIGALINEPIFYKKLTLWENILTHCEYLGFYNKEEIKEVLKKVGLAGLEKSKIKELSLGERQRLGIAYALITKPELLILDEPTNGLDPVDVVKLREMLLKLNKEFNTTIIISSHNIQELEKLVTNVALIKNGQILEEGTLEGIKEKCSVFIEMEVEETSRALAILERNMNLKNAKVINNSTIRVYEGLDNRKEILNELAQNNVGILSFNMIQITLEEYFINRIKGEL